MGLVLKILTVLGVSAVELWAGIPTGLALGLPPLAVGIAAAAGAILGVLIVTLLGDRMRARLLGRQSRAGDGSREGRIRRIWVRYGIAGLGLLAPLVTGGPLGAALGIAFGAPARRLLFWMSIGIVLWSAGLTAAAVLGIAGIRALLR